MSQPYGIGYLNIIDRCRSFYRKPVIIDIDDLITEIPSDHPEYTYFTNTMLPQIIQSASHVCYSTKFMATRLGHLNTNHTVVPNSIDADRYNSLPKLPKPHKNCFIVGWTGGQSHRSDQYYTFLDDLRTFLRAHNDCKAYFHVLCPDILLKEFGSQIIYEPNPCDFVDYATISSQYPFDVCLVGLQKNNFNEAKSDLKLLEMAPHDIPLIASPRSDFLQHKERYVMLYAENGSGEHDSWLQQLEWCYEHQAELKETAARAKNYVFENRTSQHAADTWLEVLRQYV